MSGALAAKARVLWQTPVLLGLITLLGAALRWYDLGAESYWLDEVDTVGFASRPISLLWRIFFGLDRAPLYYFFAHGWVSLFGTSEVVMRLPSAIAGTIAVPILFLIGRALFDRSVGLLAALLLATSEFAIRQAQEARYYSLVLLLTLLAYWFMLRARDRRHGWDFFLAMSAMVLLVYLHYFAISVVLAQWLYLLLRRPWRGPAGGTARRWLRWQILLAVCLGPLVLLLARTIWRGRGIALDWIPAPRLWWPLLTIWRYLIPQRVALVGIVAVGALVALVVVGLVRHKGTWSAAAAVTDTAARADHLWLIGLWMVCPVVLPLVLSWLVTPLYVERYTTPALPAVALLAAAGIVAARSVLPTALALALLAVPLVPGLVAYYRTPVNEQWREIAAQVDAAAQPGDMVLFVPAEGNGLAGAFGWYDRRALPKCGIDYRVRGTEQLRAALANCGDPPRLWLVLRHNADRNPERTQHLMAYFVDATPPDLVRLDSWRFGVLTLVLFARRV